MIVPRWLFLYLWIAPHTLQAVLAIIMVYRKLVRTFPVFFAYTIYEVVQFLVLFLIDQSASSTGAQYAGLFLAGGAVSIALRFGVVYEIFRTVFASYPALQKFGWMLFSWATVVLMIVAVTVVAYSTGTDLDRYAFAYTVVDRIVSIMQCGLLVLLILMARFLSFPWTSCAFGITLGLGLFASVELGIRAIQAEFGIYIAQDVVDPITMAVYHCCVVFWIVSVLLPERSPRSLELGRSYDLEHWNDALQRLLHQ
jgi:hypothetical protein